jgi:hypothetical protein
MWTYQILLVTIVRGGTLSSGDVSVATTVLNFGARIEAEKALSNLKDAYPKHLNTPTFSLEITELY